MTWQPVIEEVSRLMQEFDKHEIDMSVQLDAYAAEQHSQMPGIRVPETFTQPPRPSTTEEQVVGSESDDEQEHQEEPWLFNIFQK